MHVRDRETRPQHRLVPKPIRRPKAWADVQVMSPNWNRAVATERAVSGKLKRAEMPAGGRIGREGIEERHAIRHFLKWAPDVPTDTYIQRQPRTHFDVVLNVRGVVLIAAARFSNGVLSYAAAIHCAQQIARVTIARVAHQCSSGRESRGFIVAKCEAGEGASEWVVEIIL